MEVQIGVGLMNRLQTRYNNEIVKSQYNVEGGIGYLMKLKQIRI